MMVLFSQVFFVFLFSQNSQRAQLSRVSQHTHLPELKMKYMRILLTTLLSICFLAAPALQNERRTILWSAGDSTEVFRTIEPNEIVTIPAAIHDVGTPMRRFLRVVGNTVWPAPWDYRGERNFRYVECLVDDYLDSTITHTDHYSLHFSGNNDSFERHALNRVMGTNLHGGSLHVSIPVLRRERLATAPDGDFGLALEIYLKRDGRAPEDIFDAPDTVIAIPIPGGTSHRITTVEADVTLPPDVACIVTRLGGTRFAGDCWVEAPTISQDGMVVWRDPFVMERDRTAQRNYWVGINMSTAMWRRWNITFGDVTVKDGLEFDRCSNIADFMIPLPPEATGNGPFRLKLVEESHRANYPYQLRRVELIEETARDFEVAYCPTAAYVGEPLGVLVETNRPDITLSVKSTGAKPERQTITLDEPGLHVVQVTPLGGSDPLHVTISDGTRLEPIIVFNVRERKSPPVLLSSGDEIYVPKDPAVYDYFFKWYLRYGVGNAYHFRPSYQWNGTREPTADFMRRYTRLLTDLHMPYAWQVEGRNLAASRLNPPTEALESPMFMGRQAHENDGDFYYWTQFKYVGLFSDIAARTRPYGGIFAKHRPIFTPHGDYIFYDRQGVADMADGARKFVENLRSNKGESTRHTGPSSLFRYFYQAGYDWLGAEQMYGPEEKIMSALRGASRAYGKSRYGSLHAMQWLRPYQFTKPGHALRHFLSLATAYMHGSSHINTEEALWTDELLHDRYSTSGQEHMKAQNLMLEFIQNHDREGEMVTPVAVIQGRNDAWRSFGRGPVWEQDGKKWRFNRATESFDLTTSVFYPENGTSDCGPDGWFTSMPFGAIDILPIEAPQEALSRYRVLAFLGWNTFDAADFQRLRGFVERGGTLVLTAAHINACLQPDEPAAFPADDSAVQALLGDNYRALTEKTVITKGLGRVIYYPQNVYPADPTIRADYEATLRRLADDEAHAQWEKGWISDAPHVSWTVWDRPDGTRTIYLLNINWRDPRPETATLHVGGREQTITVEPWEIKVITPRP